MRILLADDQPHICSALRLLFENEPDIMVVGEARDTGQLMYQANSTQPDLLLLDWELPGLSGPDLLPVLRADYPWLSVIALSGRLEAHQAALAAGADAFISKADPPEQLVSLMRKFVRPPD